jgi:hypothetical protein
VRDVVVSGVTARVQGTSRIQGPPERPIERVVLSGIRLFVNPESTPDKRATHGLLVEGVDGLRVRDLELRWAEERPEPRWGSAVVVRRSRDVELSAFVGESAPSATGAAAVEMEDVEGALVRACRPTGGLFLRVAGKSRAIRLVGNDLSASSEPVSYAVEGLRGAVAVEGSLLPR